jgi:serine/threonine-protein kinase
MHDNAQDEMIGRRFGKEERLVVKRRLNKGGIGTVYEAWDTKKERRVAMKFLHPEFAETSEWQTRFRREGDKFAALKHPNIVQVYGLGREHGLLYIACEFVEGRTLRELVEEKGALDLESALRICRDVASALKAAHAENVVHRDLKPDNIMVRNDDGRVVLLDFGIAKPLDSHTIQTKAGAYLGTPGYSPPEQIKGLPIDHRTDIFPLGIILFELVTGKLAFEGKDTRAVLIGTIETDPLDKIDKRFPLPKAVRRLVDKMIQKDPRKRFQSMDEVIEAIDRAGDATDEEAAEGKPGILSSFKRLFSR